MKTLLPKPFRWAAALFLLTLALTCWRPLGVMAQRSQWYRVAEAGYPTGGAATGVGSNGVYRDADGNLIYPITFQDSVTFQGVHLVSSATDDHYDFAIFKVSPAGQLLWHWQPGGSGGRRRPSDIVIATDSASNIIVCGVMQGGTLIADGIALPSRLLAGSLFLLKLSADGHVQWAQTVANALSQGSDAFTTNSLTVDHRGNTLLPGYYDGEMAIGGQPMPIVGNRNAFLVKIAPDGTIVWVKNGTGGNTMRGGWVCVDADDAIYFSASYVSFGTFAGVNVGVSSGFRDQCFLMKISPAGQIIWTRQFSSPSAPGAALQRLVMHPSGDLLLRLRATGTAFGVQLPTNVNMDMMRISSAGVARWVRRVPFIPEATFNCDPSGNIYFSWFYDNSAQNPLPVLGNGVTLPPPPAGGAYGFVVAFDENLQAQWANVAQFSSVGLLAGMTAVQPNGQVSIQGIFNDRAILGTDTLRVRPYNTAQDDPYFNFIWSFNAPLGFGVETALRRVVCPGTTFRMPFQAQVSRFGPTNVFRAELSDSTGYFGNPLPVGTLTSSGTGTDSMTITLPAGLASGAKYQVRIVSTSPVMVASGSGLALEITPAAVARILAADTVGVCPAAAFPVLRGQASFGGALQWIRNGQPLPGATTDRLALTQPGTYALAVSGGPCGPATSPSVEVLPVPTPTLTLAPFGQVLLTGASFALTGATPAGGTWSGPGVSNNRFNPATAGLGTHTLTYTFTSRYGCAATATITLDVVRVLGVGEEAGVQALTLSPNPAHGAARLTFRTAQPQAATAGLYDALGRLIHEQTLPTGTEHATTLTLPAVSGVYQVRVRLATGVVTRKLLVQP